MCYACTGENNYTIQNSCLLLINVGTAHWYEGYKYLYLIYTKYVPI